MIIIRRLGDSRSLLLEDKRASIIREWNETSGLTESVGLWLWFESFVWDQTLGFVHKAKSGIVGFLTHKRPICHNRGLKETGLLSVSTETTHNIVKIWQCQTFCVMFDFDNSCIVSWSLTAPFSTSLKGIHLHNIIHGKLAVFFYWNPYNGGP